MKCLFDCFSTKKVSVTLIDQKKKASDSNEINSLDSVKQFKVLKLPTKKTSDVTDPDLIYQQFSQCGGKFCHSNERSLNATGLIKGLDLTVVTEDLKVSDRPYEKLIKEFNLIDRFQRLNIGLVINIQNKGEHANCLQTQLEPSGFTYDSTHFTKNDISYLHLPISIENTNSFNSQIFSILIEIDKFLKYSEKTILIHCNDGCHRSMIVCCCYLIFVNEINNNSELSSFLVKKVSNDDSRLLVLQVSTHFLEHYKSLRKLYKNKKESFDFFCKTQKYFLSEFSINTIKGIPFIVYNFFEIIERELGACDSEECSLVANKLFTNVTYSSLSTVQKDKIVSR